MKYTKDQILNLCRLMILGSSRKEATQITLMNYSSSYRFVDTANQVTKIAFKYMKLSQAEFDKMIRKYH